MRCVPVTPARRWATVSSPRRPTRRRSSGILSTFSTPLVAWPKRTKSRARSCSWRRTIRHSSPVRSWRLMEATPPVEANSTEDTCLMRLVTFELSTPLGPVRRLGLWRSSAILDLNLAYTAILARDSDLAFAEQYAAVVLPPDMLKYFRGREKGRAAVAEVADHWATEGD